MIEKVVSEGLRAQEEIVKAIDRYRFSDFKIEHAEGFVRAVESMKPYEGQSGEALNLYVKSVVYHYETLRSLTETITPLESAFLEWMQTPTVLDMLYRMDSSFREAAEEFAKTVDDCDDILSLEAMRIANGFYGIISAKDFAPIPGSTYSIVRKIVERCSIDKTYRDAILSANSWGLHSYVFGNEFLRVFGETKDFNRALNAEKEAMKKMILEPVKAQTEIMLNAGFSSFDPAEYMRRYGEKMEPFVRDALKSVHLANIVMLPTHVGDVGHHIGWQYYYICRDEINMEILRVHLELLKLNLSTDAKSPFDVTSQATGISAVYLYRLLEDEGFTPEMLIRLFTERFYNYIQRKQFERNVVNELHVNDFLDFIYRGGKLKDKMELNWKPLEESELLNSPEYYAYPFCAITTKFAALMKFADMPCLLAPEPISIVSMVNAVAEKPEMALITDFCKKCATASIQPNKCLHCVAKK